MRYSVWPVRVAVALVLMAAACRGSDAIEDVFGLWEATSVNGMPVPGEVQIHMGDSIGTIDIRYDRLRFREGGECVSMVDYGRGATETPCDYVLNVERATITIRLPYWAPPFELNLDGRLEGRELTVAVPNRGGPPNVTVYAQQ